MLMSMKLFSEEAYTIEEIAAKLSESTTNVRKALRRYHIHQYSMTLFEDNPSLREAISNDKFPITNLERLYDYKDGIDFFTQAFLELCKDAEFSIEDITTRPVKKSPAAPFTTSTLQQEAARKLGFTVAQTMMVAQRLYESGQITYMRTDSVNLSDLAIGGLQINCHFTDGRKVCEDTSVCNEDKRCSGSSRSDSSDGYVERDYCGNVTGAEIVRIDLETYCCITDGRG